MIIHYPDLGSILISCNSHMNVIMERHQYRVFTTGEEIREFSVNYAKLSGKCLVAYDCLLFKHGASFKYSPVTSHLSPATRILSENPAV